MKKLLDFIYLQTERVETIINSLFILSGAGSVAFIFIRTVFINL